MLHCLHWLLIIAALRSRCGHYILVLFLLFLSVFLFRRLISAVAYWMSTIVHTWCGPSANLECRSEMCRTRLAENTRRKRDAKIGHVLTITQLYYRDISSQQSEKLVKQQYRFHVPSQCGALLPTNGRDRLEGLGNPANFNVVRLLASLLQRRRSTVVNQTLHDV